MKKCTCIGCDNVATKQVSENETGNVLDVCDDHVETINQVITMEYEPLTE